MEYNVGKRTAEEEGCGMSMYSRQWGEIQQVVKKKRTVALADVIPPIVDTTMPLHVQVTQLIEYHKKQILNGRHET